MELSRRAMDIKPSSTMAITAKALEMKNQGLDVISFGAGEPDFDTPKHIKDAGITAIEEGFTKYTAAPGIPELRKVIAEKLRIDNGIHYAYTQIVVSNGAKSALMNTFLAILNEGDEVMIPAPFWLSYSEMVKIAGGIPVIVQTKPENNFMITREELLNAWSEKTKAFVLTSPSNPTGMVTERKDLEMIAALAIEKDFFIISDEIYEHLIYEENKKHVSIASLGEEIKERTIVINGVSKSFAMTGWRIGFSASNAQVAKLIASLQSHMASNPNSIAQKAALAALIGPQDCVEEMCKEFKKRRDYIFQREENIPYLHALKPEGAFYLFVDVTGLFGKSYQGEVIQSAAQFAAALLEKKHVAVVPCKDFGMENYIRLSYAISMESIQKGMDRMEELVRELI